MSGVFDLTGIRVNKLLRCFFCIFKTVIVVHTFRSIYDQNRCGLLLYLFLVLFRNYLQRQLVLVVRNFLGRLVDRVDTFRQCLRQFPFDPLVLGVVVSGFYRILRRRKCVNGEIAKEHHKCHYGDQELAEFPLFHLSSPYLFLVFRQSL